MDWPERVGAVVFDPFTDQILLQRRGTVWSCFGVDRDLERKEKPLDAIKRGIQKRLGLEVVDNQLRSFGAFPTTKGRTSAQYAVFYHEEGNPTLLTDPSRKWFTFEEIAALDKPSIERHTRKSIENFAANITLANRNRYREVLRGLGLSTKQ